ASPRRRRGAAAAPRARPRPSPAPRACTRSAPRRPGPGPRARAAAVATTSPAQAATTAARLEGPAAAVVRGYHRLPPRAPDAPTSTPPRRRAPLLTRRLRQEDVGHRATDGIRRVRGLPRRRRRGRGRGR